MGDTQDYAQGFARYNYSHKIGLRFLRGFYEWCSTIQQNFFCLS